MTLKHIIYAAALLPMLAACGSNEIYSGTGYQPGDELPGQNIPTVCGDMENFTIEGFVTDAYGEPLYGVEVVSGTASALTNPSGFFSLGEADINNGRSIVRFSKPGYFNVTRSLSYETQGEVWRVTLQRMGETSTASASFYSGEAKGISASGMSVSLPADGYVNLSDGERYNGTVNVEMFALTPDNPNFSSLMPGGDLLASTGTGGTQALISYGMVNVKLTGENGEPLQLLPGKRAKIALRVSGPESDTPPTGIPLWSFNEVTGLWDYEGSAYRSTNGDGTYNGEVSHFSWVNFDTPEDVAYVRGRVTDTDGQPIQGVQVDIYQFSVTTNRDGEYYRPVAADTEFKVGISSENYFNYEPEQSVKVGPIAPQQTVEQDFVLPALHEAYGRVVNNAGSRLSFPVWLEGKRAFNAPLQTSSPYDGTFHLSVPAGYSGETTFCLELPDGQQVTVNFTMPSDADYDLGDIVIDENGVAVYDNFIDVVNCPQGANERYSFPFSDVSLDGAIVSDGVLLITNGVDFDEMESYYKPALSIMIGNYSPDESEYNDAVVMIQDRGRIYMTSAANVTLTKNNGIFTLQIYAKGVITQDDNGNGKYYENAEITSLGFTVPHLLTMELKYKYTPVAPVFASFTPRLSTPAPRALVITESQRLGTGGTLFYNGSKDVFESLLAQARATDLKEIDLGDDEEDEYYFIKAKDSLSLYYDPSADEISSEPAGSESIIFEEMDLEAQISITSLHGGKVSIYDIALSRGASQENDFLRILKSCKKADAKIRKYMKSGGRR